MVLPLLSSPCLGASYRDVLFLPYSLFLVIEGLSLLISQAHSAGVISGIKLAPQLYLTHLLFVDDAILFGVGTLSEWKYYKHILDTFYSATGMEINVDKSSFLFHNIDEVTKQQISNILSYKMQPLTASFKYLSYYLKPLGYGIKDWKWFILKFERKLNNWTFKFLSLGGKLFWSILS